MTGIRVERLSKTYRRGLQPEPVRALDDVSLEITPGEAFGIIGPNGAGKTTFLGCLLGFLQPDSGTVTIDGHEPDDLAVRSVTGYLPERLVLDKWMTGGAFIRYQHALARLPEERRAADADSALERVGLDGAAARRPIRKYSRGMLQRLGLAQSLLGSPRYLFLDEPASGVDPAGVILFRRLLGELKASGVTLVLNSHHLDQVERVCDRVAFVNRGRVEAIETVGAGSEVARVMRVRWAGHAIDPAWLANVAQGAGATLERTAGTEGHFSVADDAGAARLLQALIQNGVQVAEAAPEESRLERLFTEPGSSGDRKERASDATSYAGPHAATGRTRGTPERAGAPSSPAGVSPAPSNGERT